MGENIINETTDTGQINTLLIILFHDVSTSGLGLFQMKLKSIQKYM